MKSSLFANKSDAACGQNVGTKKLLKEHSIKNPNIINMLGFVMWWAGGNSFGASLHLTPAGRPFGRAKRLSCRFVNQGVLHPAAAPP